MAPKTSLRDNPPSASSSSSPEESGHTPEASGSSEYDTSEDEAAEPNDNPGASSTSESDDGSGNDSAKPSGKTDDSLSKAPSQPTKKPKTPVSSSQSDSGSGDDEASNPTRKLGGSSSKTPLSPASKNKPQSEESGSDSETESSEGNVVTDRNQKPGSLSSKLSKQQKPLLVSSKRKADTTPDPKSSKQAKREVDEKKLALISIQDSEKKNPFQRVFTDIDEIEILKGTCEYGEKKKVNVVHDTNDLYDFIKRRIETKFTKSQLLNKLQSMKKRFLGHENRINKGLKALKPLDPTIYELSNKLWGPGGFLEKTEKELVVENTTPAKARKLLSSSKFTKNTSMVASAVSNNPNPTDGVLLWYLSENLGICHKGGGVDPAYMREVMDSVDEYERAELESRWRKNQAAMAKVVEERLMIAQQVCQLVDKHSCSTTTTSPPY